MPVSILILFDPKGPAIEFLAQAAADGVVSASRGPANHKAVSKSIFQATTQDLLEADGLLLGSPNWSGLTGSLKSWLDEQGDLWEEGSLAGKPGAAFTSGWGRHSGLEMTLLQLIHWMLACGMVVVGMPWSDAMRTSGSYYGATAVGGVTDDDLAQARDLGARVATIAAKLKEDQSPN